MKTINTFQDRLKQAGWVRNEDKFRWELSPLKFLSPSGILVVSKKLPEPFYILRDEEFYPKVEFNIASVIPMFYEIYKALGYTQNKAQEYVKFLAGGRKPLWI